jgi:hypothetical protein
MAATKEKNDMPVDNNGSNPEISKQLIGSDSVPPQSDGKKKKKE